jgi:hypothetical protein
MEFSIFSQSLDNSAHHSLFMFSQTPSSDIGDQHPSQRYDGAIVGMSFGMFDR